MSSCAFLEALRGVKGMGVCIPDLVYHLVMLVDCFAGMQELYASSGQRSKGDSLHETFWEGLLAQASLARVCGTRSTPMQTSNRATYRSRLRRIELHD